MATKKKIKQFIQLIKLYFSLYLGIAIAIFLFLQFFQPFTVDRFEFENKLLFLAGFGLIALIFLIVSQIVFQRTLLNIEVEIHTNSITIPLFYLLLLTTTSLAFIFYLKFVGQIGISFNTVVKIVFMCLSLPVSLHLYFRLKSYQVRLEKLQLESSLSKNKLKHFTESCSKKQIEIISDQESDNFTIEVSEIVYVKSADNYIEIGYHDEGLVKKKVLRNTLRNVERQLAEFSDFIRTHRSSLVNIQYIDKLNKNMNTYSLSLYNTQETVPVSRQYLMSVKDQL